MIKKLLHLEVGLGISCQRLTGRPGLSLIGVIVCYLQAKDKERVEEAK